MYYVNWQRQVSVEERAGQRVVVKCDKPVTVFHEYVLLSTYTMMSILLGHPSSPPRPGRIQCNEGYDKREELGRLGIPTPRLVSISDGELVEEFVEGGDLYRALVAGAPARLALIAGTLTGRLHHAGHVFTDNKAQNYLVSGESLLRTDLGFLQTSTMVFAKSMDVGSFLASVMDLPNYYDIQTAFFEGYHANAGRNFPYLSIVIRNILTTGFASDMKVALRNMLPDTVKLIGA